ncbi:Ribokinase-like protein [Pseudovirgaria hyperparasitica]|uniref:Ribokinase-like protein n=1 Tax=Pseudovirgaria hyperparasitica TaxID=470096 RepID=A0A6A6WF56_9PEZI|nr:Ribokinase-like protein [Pseudovirgaria hyperparasitica]KAF2760664.1 Ribokinase-like protein [Pseudovirgaria hyperparasitica]
MDDPMRNVPQTDVRIDFCTLGMFIIDEIHFPPPKPAATNIIGGAGAYSALGARLLSPPPLSNSVGWIIDCGSDFPSDLRKNIAQWCTTCLMRETPNRLTTRGWNGYGENEHRAFRYTTPKLRLDHESLDYNLLRSKSFHLICSPKRCVEMTKGIICRRNQMPHAQPGDPPLFIWEPVPDLCKPEELENCLEALHAVDIVSPNHSELGDFFGVCAIDGDDVSKSFVKQCADSWLASGIGRNGLGAVVVRAGKDGCYVATREKASWMPPYHRNADKVVDPTGGGNGFLGGLAIGLVRSQEEDWVSKVEDGACWGSVAASFAIEQIGMPTLESRDDGELWNGQSVFQRLSEYKEGLEQYVQP